MDNEQRREAAKQFLVDIWSQGDLSAADRLLSDDFRFELSFMVKENLADFKDLVMANRTAFENLTYTPGEVIVEDDRAVATWTMSGKHVGSWAGIEATNREVSITGMTLLSFQGEKIIKASVQNDVFGLRKQLGAA